MRFRFVFSAVLNQNGKEKGQGGEEGKKGKKKEEPEPEEPSEFDAMDIKELEEKIKELESSVSDKRNARNYTQLERDTVQTFYDITRKEIQDIEKSIKVAECDMESMEADHIVEVRVYTQKVKHLEYEHKNTKKRIDAETKVDVDDSKQGHLDRLEELRDGKRKSRQAMRDTSAENEDEVQQLLDTHKKNLSKLEETFEQNLQSMVERYDERLAQLHRDLDLKRKVETHEIEERKNLHINELMKNHEKAFGNIKTYYNDITHDNLKLIKSLKDEVTEMKTKASANQKLMFDISQENKRLSEPLSVALKEVEELRRELKDYEKDKLSLKNANARLMLIDEHFCSSASMAYCKSLTATLKQIVMSYTRRLNRQ